MNLPVMFFQGRVLRLSGAVAQLWRGVLLFTLTILLPGCAFFKDPVNRSKVATAFGAAARITTREYLVEHPEARPKFVLASQEAEALSRLTTASPAQLAALLEKLPFKELKGTAARIAFETAETLYQLFIKGLPAAEVHPAIREIAASIATGINDGLK